MKLYVQILDDDGKILAEHDADPCQPSMWRAPAGQRFVGNMPQTSDAKNNGTYELFGITFQPHLKVDRPNGWTTPPPAAAPTFPFNKTPLPQIAPWSTSAPTPQKSAPSPSGLLPPRGL